MANLPEPSIKRLLSLLLLLRQQEEAFSDKTGGSPAITSRTIARLTYKGMLVERHMGYHTDFMDQEKAQHARDFAQKLLEPIQE